MRGKGLQLPEKLYFKIGEVADLVGVKPYVLRYWESEFSIVRPAKSKSKHRLYRRTDVEALLEIRRLLHDERFTIEGARRHLKGLAQARANPGGELPAEEAAPAVVVTAPNCQPELPLGDRGYRSLLVRVKQELEALCRMLR